MKRMILGGVAISALLIAAPLSIANAADMPVKAPPMAPVVAPVYSWTGFYIGGDAGLALENASGTSNFIDTYAAPPDIYNPQSNSLHDVGFLAGGEIGYNWQVDPNWMLGVEGDWDWLRTSYNFCRQTNINSLPCTDNDLGFETIGSQTNWLATARARVGVTMGWIMVYGTGGAAWGSVATTESLSCLVEGCGSSSLKLAASSTVTQIKTGWTAGVGVEGMLDAHWSVKAEFLYVDLGNFSDTFTTVGTAGYTQSVAFSRDERFDIIRGGLNYRF